MSTPTREQVIEWAKEAGITSDDAACQIHDLTQLARIAHTAGREQGLREAKEVCEAIDPRASSNAAMLCAMKIEQLRGK